MSVQEARLRSRVIVFETNSDGHYRSACETVAPFSTVFVSMNPQYVDPNKLTKQPQCSAWVISPTDREAFEFVKDFMELAPPREGFEKGIPWPLEKKADAALEEGFGENSDHRAFVKAVERRVIRVSADRFSYKGKILGKSAPEAQGNLAARYPDLLEEIKATVKEGEEQRERSAEKAFELAFKTKIINKQGGFYTFKETRLASSIPKTKALLVSDAALLAQVNSALEGVEEEEGGK